MADKKISQLTAATTPLAGTEVLPVVQGSTTVKVSVDNLTTGKTVPAGYINIKQLNEYPANPAGVNYIRQSSAASWQTYIAADGNFSFYNSTLADRAFYMTTDGNLAVNTSGKGIDFSANTHAAGMTSELLNDYEEGTWTPIIVGSSTAGTGTYTTQVGRYTKIGRTVHFTAYVVWSAHTGTGNMSISGLPFSSEATANVFFQFSPFSSNLAYTANSQLQLLMFNNSTSLNFYQVNGGAAASQVAIDTAADVLVTGTYSI